MDSNRERGKWLLFGGYHLHWPGWKYALRGEGFRWDCWSQMYRRWRRCGGTCFDHFSLMSFILLLAEHFPYTPCNFTLDCQKMDEPCGGLMDVGCWCLFGQCVTGDEGERNECSKTEDCTKMDKCASGHCYCSESNRAGNELLLSFTISLIVYDIIHFKCTLEIVKDCEISIFAKVCFQLSI